MSLRPKAFSIPSSTQLKVTFNSSLSDSLTVSNIYIESLNGSVDDLEVTGIEINKDILLIKTRPQVTGNYYLLKFLDTTSVIFASEKGERLIDDAVSRELFFVGIDNINPIRDRLFEKVPGLFSLENSLLKNVISAQAEEIYTAQKKVGQLLSDNYISIDVSDEFRVRGSGATDRLANEQAYEILRVSKNPTNSKPKAETLYYTSDNAYSKLQVLPYYPISLQQKIIEDEEITSTSDENSFDGFLISLQNNIIKLLSLKLIKSTDVEDCNNEIGTEYNIERYKYSLVSNFYDQELAFENPLLEANQVLLSEFGNIDRPESGDTIILTYLTKDYSRAIISDSIEISRVESVTNESLPTNSTRFFLEHAPIVTSSNVIPTKGGIAFKTSENSDEIPDEFLKEIPFNIARLPSLAGEYSVNYESGEVFLVGTSERKGTDRNTYLADYLYRREFIENLDYSISNNDLIGNPNRELVKEEVEIFLNYELVYANGTDYKFSSHIEVLGEQVENRTQSFYLETENSPITNVYRILNQTTGEVYTPLYHTNTEIYFSGNRSPEIQIIEEEQANFKRIVNEELNVIGEFIIPAFKVKITSASSYNSIIFTPGIPSELISFNSDQYFAREISNSTESPEVSDLQIKFFGDSNANGLITSFAINSTATLPTAGTTIYVGNKGYIINLDNSRILNKNLDALGYHGNTSLVLSDTSVFLNEKYFETFSATTGFTSLDENSLSVVHSFDDEETLYDNLSRLRKVGDYSVDYKNGTIYLAVTSDEDLDIGTAQYYIAKHVAKNSNIVTTLSASKKNNIADNISDSNIVYSNLQNDIETVSVVDIESGFVTFDNETEAKDLNNQSQLICTVLDDYTVVVPYNIKFVNGIFRYTDIVGENLTSSISSNRVSEKTTSELNTLAINGGANLASYDSITITDNVIDLKKTVKRRIYIQDDGSFEVSVSDSFISSFYSCKKVRTGDVIYFDDSLNITKIENIIVTSSDLQGSYAVVEIESTNISDIDSSFDYLLDSDGNRFKVVEIEGSRLTLETPAENNSEALYPNLDLTGEDTVIVIKPSVSIVNNELTIIIPSDSDIQSGELLEITYLTTLTPDIGTPLFIDYRYGDIYFSYNYVYDQIAVWYEYGDNTLDWSISNTLSEGDEYYVSYRYGANRTALKDNFGSLTQVPFFQQFPLEIDRELYRNGVKGTLQAFTKGPTLPAFKSLIKSFTDIEPDINEVNYDSWVLGRDYSNPNKISHDGILQFADGKFGSGLTFDEQTVVSIPAISSISLREGTLEAWIRPSWSGINNDAKLTFHLDGIGPEKFNLLSNSDIFDEKQKWVLAPVDNFGGLIDQKGLGIRLTNFKMEEDEYYSIYNNGIYKNFDFLNRVTKLDSEFKIKINEFGTQFNRLETEDSLTLQDSFEIAHLFITDTYRISGMSFTLDEAFDEYGTIMLSSVSSGDLETETIPNFTGGNPTRICNCTITNNISIFENLNSLTITIELNDIINFEYFKSKVNVITDDPESFVIFDEDKDIYQVSGFIDSNGTTFTNSIPDEISSIIVNRFPLNNMSIKQGTADEINDLLPIGNLSLYFKGISVLGDKDKNLSAFAHNSRFVVNWSDYHNYTLNRDPVTNIVSIKFDNEEYKTFYTENLFLENASLTNFTNDIEDNHGIYIGLFQDKILATLDILSGFGTFYNRFNVTDIYIGKNGYSPKRIPFSVQKDDSPKLAVGLPNNITTDEGIFIGFDEVCTSPLSDNMGQWIFRTRADRVYTLPSDVTVSDLNDYTLHTDEIGIEHTFSGYILTDGEFCSVVRSTRDEVSGQCTDGVICDSTFRYCGNDLLETYGWKKIEESDSDLVNTSIGGRETISGLWRKEGSFETSVSSGIYRAGPSIFENKTLENILITEQPCSGGEIEYKISLRVASYESSILNSIIGSFSGSILGNLIGIVPIHISNLSFNIKVALGLDSLGSPLIAVIDGSTGTFIDIIRYSWNDTTYHEYRMNVNYSDEEINLYIDDLLLSRTLFSEYTSDALTYDKDSIGIYVFDNTLLNSEDFHNEFSGNIIDIDLIYFTGYYQEGDGYLESDDIFIHTDDRIDFEFHIDEQDGYFEDIIYDAYNAYQESISLIGVDEMLISSDRLRYIFDTGVTESQERLSLFKDGKGFLNFRIFDNSPTLDREVGIYNIATSIKDITAGDLHHVAISWKINSINNQDEMHLFLDGQEAPNLYRFGGTVPVRLNQKYSDVSKEFLQTFLVRDIVYPESYTDGTVAASSELFYSDSITFTDEHIGRSILVTDASLATTLINQEFVIKSVSNGAAVFGRGNSLTTVTFDTSDSEITFSFAPYSENILTDVRNSRFFIFRTDASEEETEMGGILYQVIDNEIDIVSGQNVLNPKYRVNVDTRIIEFVGENSDCEFIATVDETDIEIAIRTFGLNLELCREKIHLSGSSLESTDNKYSGQSVLNLHSKEPISLSDVNIKRIILDKTVMEIVSPEETASGYNSAVTIDLDEFTSKVSSATSTRLYNPNNGRYLTVVIDSDNIDFCQFDGYEDAYQDGSLDSEINTVTIYGTTTDGFNEETFFIKRNGPINGTKLFTEVTSVYGNFKIIDPNYFELGVISIEETNYLTIADNSGYYLEVYEYQSGNLILTKAESDGAIPFELHAGTYQIEYPSYLNIKVRDTGSELFIGTDLNKENSFGGIIDEFRIISEMSLDTRVTESDTSGTRSVTNDYYLPNPFCADENTLTLIHFNNPLEFQRRRLRNTEFLDTENNFKYKLTTSEQEELLALANNEEKFILKMINLGFSLDLATKTFYEVHFAENGPIWNDANFYQNYDKYILSENSINENFGKSAYFIPGSALLLENDGGLIRREEGTIEFWISPVLDTIIDLEKRYYIDISNARRIKVTSIASDLIELPNAAKNILSIKLITKKKMDSDLYSDDDEIIFDEIARSAISGKLEGGTGVNKDFSIGHKLSADGTKIYLAESLPGVKLDIIVSYVPIDSQGDRISIYKNEESQLVATFFANDIEYTSVADINWKKNTWHRIKFTYKTGTKKDDFIRVVMDGEESGYIRYGTGIIYGTGYVYGQFLNGESSQRAVRYNIDANDDLRLIAIGSDIYNEQSAYARMDNIRFSRVARSDIRDANGQLVDIDYSENENTTYPVKEDDATTLLLDFDASEEKIDNYIKVIDPKSGIFNFNIDVIDNFDKVINKNDGMIEDLIVKLVKTLKPAHTNAYVKFKKTSC